MNRTRQLIIASPKYLSLELWGFIHNLLGKRFCLWVAINETTIQKIKMQNLYLFDGLLI